MVFKQSIWNKKKSWITWERWIASSLVVRLDLHGKQIAVKICPYLNRQVPYRPNILSGAWRKLGRLTSSNVFLFGYGRKALAEGLRSLGLKPGDIVMLPEFICDVTLCAFNDLDLQPVYYPISNKFSVDWSQLPPPPERARALLVVHYFGFPQDIGSAETYCRCHNLFLIEDNAHGFGTEYRGHMLGTLGTIGIASPRKVIGDLQNGAILWLNHPVADPALVHPATEVEPIGISAAIKGAIKRFIAIMFRPFQGIGPEPNWDAMSPPEPLGCPNVGVDQRTLNKIQRTELNQLRCQRQALYQIWMEFALKQGLEPVYGVAPDGVSPLCCPCRAKNINTRDRWLRWGYLNGIDIYTWPTLPPAQRNPESASLMNWQTLICFPINDIFKSQWLKALLDEIPPPGN